MPALKLKIAAKAASGSARAARSMPAGTGTDKGSPAKCRTAGARKIRPSGIDLGQSPVPVLRFT